MHLIFDCSNISQNLTLILIVSDRWLDCWSSYDWKSYGKSSPLDHYERPERQTAIFVAYD